MPSLACLCGPVHAKHKAVRDMNEADLRHVVAQLRRGADDVDAVAINVIRSATDPPFGGPLAHQVKARQLRAAARARDAADLMRQIATAIGGAR